MTRSIHSILAALITFVLGLPLAQAQTPVRDVSITHIEATALGDGQVRVTTFVSVLDETGTPVADLSTDDFTLEENITLIEPQALTVVPATAPVTVTLLIDTSRRMRNLGPNGTIIDTAKNLAITLMENLASEDQVAVYEYNTELNSQQDLTYDHNLVINQLISQTVVSEVETACLYDALSAVIDHPANQRQGRRLILVLTGNWDSANADTCSGTTVDDVIEAATTIGSAVPIYTIGFGAGTEADQLERLSQRTGGKSLDVSNSTLLADLSTQLLGQLKNQYEISYATQASGLAIVKVTENSSQQADDRQLFIPAAIPPTPTPLPQFAISLTANQTDDGVLIIKVAIPDDVILEQTELFVDNKSIQKVVSSPFDQFELNMFELGSGKHKIWVQATDINKVSATAEIEIDLTILPTPVPTVPPTPPALPHPTPAPEPDRFGTIPILSLLLIIAGLVILLALVGLIGYLLFFYAKRPVRTPPPPPPLTPVSPLITIDDELPVMPPRPVADKEVMTRRARLVAVTGREALPQPEFLLQKAEVKLGRNTAKENSNDIPIQDKEVSRSHAKIIYRNQNFFIRDLNSSSGITVNQVKVQPAHEMVLRNGAEIMVGPNVRLRFEVTPPRSAELTLADFVSHDGLRTQDDTEDPDQTFIGKKIR